MRQLCAIIVTLSAIATLTFPGNPPRADRAESSASIDPICRLYLDPHDHFTRVVLPAGGARLDSKAALSGRLRSNAALSTIQVNYTGFTAEAKTAFQAAIDIWLTQVSSSIPIVVDAQYTDLGNPLLLGQAGFRSMSANFSGAPIANASSRK